MSSSVADLPPLSTAVLRTLAYADVFAYPLTVGQVHRYLIGLPASLEQVQALLAGDGPLEAYLEQQDGFYTLAGGDGCAPMPSVLPPENIVEVKGAAIAKVQRRYERSRLAAELWPRAVRYGRLLGRLPFVRMVAITGALAMDNEGGRDLDYLIISAPGRLWTCRALVVLVVRQVGLWGDVICPNYVLSEQALLFPEQNLYSAHEVTQMAPVSGLEIYARLRRLNDWTACYLPNAHGAPSLGTGPAPGRPISGQGKHFESGRPAGRKMAEDQTGGSFPGGLAANRAGRYPWSPEVEPFNTGESRLVGYDWAGCALCQRMRGLAEAALRSQPGGWFERWEMQRKVRRFRARGGPEAVFSADQCKGHFNAYGGRVLEAYRRRLAGLGLEEFGVT